MLVDPFQQLSLILQAVVETKTVCSDFVACKEAVRTHTIVEIHNNHVHARGLDKIAAIVVRIGVPIEATTLNEDKNGKQIGACGVGRGIDICKQAIFGLGATELLFKIIMGT